MIHSRTNPQTSYLTWLIVLGVLAVSGLIAAAAAASSLLVLAAVPILIAACLLLLKPQLGLYIIILAALVVPLEIGSGTAVALNPVTMLLPVLLCVWFVGMFIHKEIRLVRARLFWPLGLFLLGSLLSLVIGTVIWDPFVPRPNNFLLVQLAQWGIFALSAAAFLFMGNLVRSEKELQHVTAVFLLVAGTVAILRVVSLATGLTQLTVVATGAFTRSTFWMLLTAVAGGQLLFNKKLRFYQRLFLIVVLAAVVVYSFVQQQETLSNWIGVGVVAVLLAWFRWPQIRWPAIIFLVALLLSGVLLPFIWNVSGGDAEWWESGGSRLALIERVIEVTARNPITGIGPAAYRPYARVRPLPYRGALWPDPQVSAHNNYVDIYSHAGLLGLFLFAWFAFEVMRLGLRLRKEYKIGFNASYINSMLAAGAGALTLMLLADWVLPFVYNIGFFGFQASVLVWFFIGGLVAIQSFPKSEKIE